MIGLEQWRAAVGAWHAGSLRAYRHYVNGKRSIARNWQTLLLCRGAASIQYSICWIIAVLFAFVSEGVASALGFNADCQSLCTSVKSPGKVCQDSLQHLRMITSTFAATVRSCAVDLYRLVKSTSPSLASMLRLLIALHWLLIVAGDVELNPGPVSQELKALLETTDKSVLVKDDVFSVYCEVLDLAPKWMDVGLMLGLEHSSLEKISTTYQESPRECIILCLMEVLEHWLKQMYDVDRHGLPTWKKMVEVTAHPVAGNDPALAATLARNHQGTTPPAELSIVSSNTVVSLHSQYLRGTAQTASGTTPPAKPSVVSLHTQYLRGRYQTQIPTFLTLQWPPPPTRKFFNLAMIQGETIRHGPIDEDMVRLILRGKVSDILHEKKPVQLKDIFKVDDAKRKVILIEGPPGSGKSTLAWHVCQTWESGKLFQNFRTVIYVQLRDPMIQSAKSVEDLVPAESRGQAEQVMAEFRAYSGQNLLLVIDGWDKLPSDLHSNSIFQQLIAFPETLDLHLSTVIVTSRPIASSDLYRFISSRIEILGFTPTEVRDYFTEALGGDARAVEKLQDQLKECPMVGASCYLPLNAAIVSHLFLAQNYSLPTTLYGVFTMLVLCCLKRHVAKQEGELGKQQITSLDNLPLDIRALFKDVYTLAYVGVMDNKATFPMEYLESRGLPKISQTLGLLQGVESVTPLDDSSLSYHFLHLSVQELLASFHISMLHEKEQVSVFKEIFSKPQFAGVFRFYVAFTKLENEGMRRIVSDIVKEKNKHQILYLLHGLYEAQSLSLCEFVGSQLGRVLNLSQTPLSPVDCLAVGYFISCFSGEFTAVLVRCSLDSYRVRYLSKELFKCTSSISMRKPDSAAKDAGVSSCLELNLNLSGNSVGDEGAALLCGENVNHLLKTLHLDDNGITEEGGRAIADSLKGNKSLRKLDLSYNQISDKGSIAIAEALKFNQSLTSLNLSFNHISDEGGRAITEALKDNQNLTTLHLFGNQITDGEARAIAETLKVKQSLTMLECPFLFFVADLYGVDVISETRVSVTNVSQTFHWTGYGLKLYIPPDSLPAFVEQTDIVIRASLAGHYQFPENTTLVSAVYWLKCPVKFTKPVTLEIQHCGKSFVALSFVRAKCSQKDLPYLFKPLKGEKGVFSSDYSYGSVSLSSFSGVGIVQEDTEEQQYCGRLYYLGSRINWRVDFVVIKNLEAFITVVNETYMRKGAIDGPNLDIEFEGNKITMESLERDPITVDGWTIIALVPPLIQKKNVDSYKIGQRIPSCQLRVKWNKDQPPVDFYTRVILCGAKEPSYITIQSDPLPLVTAHTPQGTIRQKEDATKETGYSKLQRKRDTIIQTIADLGFTRELAEKLHGADMIPRRKYDEANNYAPGVVERDRATVLFNAVLASVRLNPAKYNKFIAILKQIQGSEDLVAFIEADEVKRE